MKIVIAGAGAVGFHLAELISMENQDITLIDTDEEILLKAALKLDVLTLKGDASSPEILKQAKIEKADLLLAVTTSEKTNLLTAILAKQLGAKMTVSRVSSLDYLEEKTKDTFRSLGIDNLFSPVQLASKEIERLVEQGSATDIFDFEEGKLSLLGFTLDEGFPFLHRTLKEINNTVDELPFRVVVILRGGQTLIPRGKTVLKNNDHLYLATPTDRIPDLMKFMGKEKKRIKKVMIIGGTALALRTAHLLEKKYSITIVEEDKETCKKFVQSLNNSLVVEADPSNIHLLKEEGLKEMDAFIALTPNSETNIITSLMAEQNGVFKTIASVDNTDYIHISQNIGIDTLINKKLIAANNIFRYIRKGKVEAITSLHGVEGETIEFTIHKPSRLTEVPIRELHFPRRAIIVGVIRGEEVILPSGNLQIQLGDKVIVFSTPDCIGEIEEIFR